MPDSSRHVHVALPESLKETLHILPRMSSRWHSNSQTASIRLLLCWYDENKTEAKLMLEPVVLLTGLTPWTWWCVSSWWLMWRATVKWERQQTVASANHPRTPSEKIISLNRTSSRASIIIHNNFSKFWWLHYWELTPWSQSFWPASYCRGQIRIFRRHMAHL